MGAVGWSARVLPADQQLTVTSGNSFPRRGRISRTTSPIIMSDTEGGGFEGSSRSSRASSVSSISSRSSSTHSRQSSRSAVRQTLTTPPPFAQEGYQGHVDAPQQYGDHSNPNVSHGHHTTTHKTKHESTTISHALETPMEPEHPIKVEPLPKVAPTFKDALLSKLALPLAILVGAGLAGGTTYAVVARVQHLLATAAVNGDLSLWKRKARNDVYDACYHGCTSCNDPEFAFKACQLSARAIVKGITCDGNLMWNWRDSDRYPDACLSAIANILMGDELDRLKQSYRNQYGLIALTVVAGVLTGFLVWKLLRCATLSRDQRRAELSSLKGTGKKLGKSKPAKRAGKKGGKKLFTGLLGLFSAARGARAADSYPCAGRDPAWHQFFASPNDGGQIAGVVHGWFSQCRDKQDCTKSSCKNTCTTNASGSRTCSTKCTTTCKTVVVVERVPKDFVDQVVPKIKACGFQTRDAPDGKQLGTRVGNAGIEKNYWVRISVNGLNVTRGDQTDKMVMCLHGIGDS